MSILIKGMEMPTSCGFCSFEQETEYGYECYINGCLTEYQKRPDDCPLVPVPPHGDLIDYEFCMKNYELLHDDDGNPVYAVRMRDINSAPAIIPADKEGGE